MSPLSYTRKRPLHVCSAATVGTQITTRVCVCVYMLFLRRGVLIFTLEFCLLRYLMHTDCLISLMYLVPLHMCDIKTSCMFSIGKMFGTLYCFMDLLFLPANLLIRCKQLYTGDFIVCFHALYCSS